jgi:hypothetical protein
VLPRSQRWLGNHPVSAFRRHHNNRIQAFVAAQRVEIGRDTYVFHFAGEPLRACRIAIAYPAYFGSWNTAKAFDVPGAEFASADNR